MSMGACNQRDPREVPLPRTRTSVCPALRSALIAARRRTGDHRLVLVADPEVTYGVISDVLRCARGDANDLFTDVTFQVTP